MPVKQPRLGGADNLPQNLRKVYDNIAEITDRITSRKSIVLGLGGPRDRVRGSSEVVLARMVQTNHRRAAAGVGLGTYQSRQFLDDVKPLDAGGALYVTDSRLVLVRHRRNEGVWEYAQTSSVCATTLCDGIEVTTTGKTDKIDCLMHFVNPYIVKVLQYSLIPSWRGIFSAEAAYVCSVGGDWTRS